MSLSIGNYISSETIYTEQGLKEQVLDYTDWIGQYKFPTSFALFSAMGNIGTTNNPEVMMNNITGIPRRSSLAANLTTLAPGSSGVLDIETATGGVFDNDDLRVGYAFRINGYTASASSTLQSALVKVVDKVGGNLVCKTLYSTSSAAITFLASGVGGAADTAFIHLTNSEDLSGSAPEGTTLFPDQRKNWTQLYRHAYTVTEDMESADKFFSNTRLNNSKEAEELLHGSINHDLLFSAAPLKAGANETGGALGTGDGSQFMGGLPWLLGCDDLSNSDTIYHSSAVTASGTSITTTANAIVFIDELYAWADKFKNTGAMLYGLTSKAMRARIRRAIMLVGDTLTRGKVELPSLSFYYDELDLGDIRLRLLIDDDLSSGSPMFIYDGTNKVYRNHLIIALDMSTIGLMYRTRKDQGIMAPKNVPVGKINNEYVYRAEWVAELTCGIKRQDRNGVFFEYFTSAS